MLIKELTLPTLHASKLSEFYTSVLGLDLIWKNAQGFSVAAGLSQLTFREGTGESSGPAHFAFNIPQNQIEAALSWLQDRTAILSAGEEDIAYFEGWNAHAVYFTDPDGNILECIARHDLPNHSEEAFSADSLLNISEIGVPAPSVKSFHDQLLQHFGLPLWRGDDQHFAAIGDEQGLFIVVPEGRHWFPTEVPASACSCSLSFLYEGKMRTLTCKSGVLTF